MAYRISHFRRGYYRRTPSGNITWVSPTMVSGYEYSPGKHNVGNYRQLNYYKNKVPLANPIDQPDNDTIRKIVALFSTLASDERKYCLDILECLDIELDEKTKDYSVRDTTNNSSSNEFEFVLCEDNTLCISRYKAFESEDLTIPSSIGSYRISGIGDGVFKGCNNLKRITISDGIQKIGNESFFECKNLEVLALPDSLKSIGKEAFACTNIQNLTVPDSVEQIDDGCFRHCKSLERVILSKNLKTIKTNMFKGCVSLRTVIIPPGVKSIRSGSFSEIKSVSLDKKFNDIEFFIPDSVNTISDDAFGSFVEHPFYIFYCNAGSYALQYARNNNIKYLSLQEKLSELSKSENNSKPPKSLFTLLKNNLLNIFFR